MLYIGCAFITHLRKHDRNNIGQYRKTGTYYRNVAAGASRSIILDNLNLFHFIQETESDVFIYFYLHHFSIFFALICRTAIAVSRFGVSCLFNILFFEQIRLAPEIWLTFYEPWKYENLHGVYSMVVSIIALLHIVEINLFVCVIYALCYNDIMRIWYKRQLLLLQ